jgi:hypothetical protein
MNEYMRRQAQAPRTAHWVDGLAIAAVAVAIVLLRALGTLPPDATSPLGPWSLDALLAAMGVIGG